MGHVMVITGKQEQKKILWDFVECMRNIPRQCDIMRISVILMGGIHLDNANNSAVTVIKYGDFFFFNGDSLITGLKGNTKPESPMVFGSHEIWGTSGFL